MAGRSLGAISVTFFVLASALIVPASAGLNTPRPGTDFTLIVIPETQLAVQNQPELFYAQTRWILEHNRSRDIPFVVQVGDLVQWPARASDWQRAAAALYPLNRRVPDAIAVGNHDFDAWSCEPTETCDLWARIEADRSATIFNTYFPRSMFERWPSFGGSHPRGTMDNSYFTFTGEDVAWLLVTPATTPRPGLASIGAITATWSTSCRPTTRPTASRSSPRTAISG